MQSLENIRDYMTNENLFLSWVRNGAILIVAGLAFRNINVMYSTLIIILGASFIIYSGLRYCSIKAVLDKKEKAVISGIPIRIFGSVAALLSIGLIIIVINQILKNS